MSEQKTIVILPDVRTINLTRGSLYYFAGNFFWPISLHGSAAGKIARGIREFIKENRDLVLADRARPDYLTIEQLCDLRPYDAEPG